MESSPQSIAMRRSKISLSRRPLKSDSPKTPGRLINTSSDTFHTSPSLCSANIQQSTPLNRYKRTCFVEESPSQDYNISPRPLTMSQDVRSNIIDVEWKWDEQCPVAKEVNEAKSRRVEPSKIIRRSKKAILRESPECVQKKGFHKFKEELLRNVISDVSRTPSVFKDFNKDEQDSSSKENDSLLEINSLAIVKEAKNVCNEPRTSELIEMPKPKLEIDLFDDLDLPDHLLFHCSQQAEETYHNRIKRKKIDNEATFDKLDSFDELLSSIPMNESCIKSDADNEKQPTSSKYSTLEQPLQCRSPLMRHNSMPTNARASKCISNEPAFSLSRYNRVLLHDNGIGTNSGFSSYSSPAVTSETETRRCTAEEINQKRLEAMQRRQARKLKEPGNTNFIQKSLDIEKQQFPPEYSSSPPQRRSSFIRHNSMPTNANISVSNAAIISPNRCNSVPINDIATLSSRLPSNSSEFAEIGKRQCTPEEINQKRLEAIQRREASKQKIASKSAVTTRIISLNMKYNAS